MKLSSRSKHAVRLVLEVARRGGTATPVCLSEISSVSGTSRRFLEQLAIVLKRHSLICGVSGRNGGYVLARPADQITIGDVLRAAIGPIDLASCTADRDICMSSEFCECRLVWMLLKQHIHQVLDLYTFADILDKDWIGSVSEEIQAFAVEPDDRNRMGEKPRSLYSITAL